MTVGLQGAAVASLRDARELVDPALRAAVARLDPTSRALSDYHLGWTEVDGTPTGSSGGKAVRPALALLSARAAGAPAEAGLPGAVAVELVHNFSLLHDDLMDGDVERRHRRTVWAQWGPASAILTGDAMLALASQVLLEAPGTHVVRAARLLADATQELVRGQVEDLAFETRAAAGPGAVALDECLRMAAGKTGALLAASAAIGAALAGGPDEQVEALSQFGAELGLAFQLVDDLLGIWGDPATTGKPVMSDLQSRKKSLPVTAALGSGTAAAAELGRWLSAPLPQGEVPTEELSHAARLVEEAGGRAWATGEAERRLAAAEAALARAGAPDGVTEELQVLARYVVTRES